MAEDFGAVEMCRLAEYDSKGIETRKVDLQEQNKMWQHPWMLVHRVRLHDRLKLVATGKDGQGTPAELHLSSKVVEVDPENASFVLESGEKVHADLILGADGIYVSKPGFLDVLYLTRQFVSGQPSNLFGSGKAAFRFLICRKTACEDPQIAKLLENDNELVIWYGTDRRVVVYPCDNNELLNFVCIHPEAESQGGSTGMCLSRRNW